MADFYQTVVIQPFTGSEELTSINLNHIKKIFYENYF